TRNTDRRGFIIEPSLPVIDEIMVRILGSEAELETKCEVAPIRNSAQVTERRARRSWYRLYFRIYSAVVRPKRQIATGQCEHRGLGPDARRPYGRNPEANGEFAESSGVHILEEAPEAVAVSTARIRDG